VHKSAASAGEAWLFCTKRGKGRSDTMPGFGWTGPLRPARIGPTRQVRRCWVAVAAAAEQWQSCEHLLRGVPTLVLSGACKLM
jgi:hypothetical protein